MLKMSLGLRQLVMFLLSITVGSGLVYVAAQQSYRQGANDPQIQMAEDFAAALAEGASYASIVPEPQSVDIQKSLSPFTVIYDKDGVPIVGSGILNKEYPNLPAGVFDFTRTNGEDRITWQPDSSTRVALVVARYDGVKTGFVAAGRSLKEVDKRVDKLTLYTGFTWAILMIAGFVLLFHKDFHKPDRHDRRTGDRF